jgi:hypothetical protein
MKTLDFRIWFEQLPRLSRGQSEQVRRSLGKSPPPQTVQWLEHFHQPCCPNAPAKAVIDGATKRACSGFAADPVGGPSLRLRGPRWRACD